MISRLALSFALGYGAVGLLAVSLATFNSLRAGPLVVWLVTLTLGTWVAAIWRWGLRAHISAIAKEIHSHPWSLAGGLLIVLAIVMARLATDPLTSLPGVASFRYWADATELVDSGGFPELTLQYGEMIPPATSKSLLDAFTAAVILLIGRDPLAVLDALLFVGSVGLAVALWAAAWELGLRFLSVLLPLLLVANETFLNPNLTFDLDVYRAETFGRMVAASAIAVGVRALRNRDWLDAICTGVVAGFGIGTHLIALLIAVIVLAWYLVTRLLLRAPIRELVLRSTAVLAIAVLLGGLISLLPRGEMGFEGASGSGYDKLDYEFDPTLYLLSGRQRQPTPDELSEEAESGPSGLLESAFNLSLPSMDGKPFLIPGVVLLATLAIAILMFIYVPVSLKHLGLVGWGAMVTMVALTLFFAYRNDVFLLVVWGRRRLFDYSAIPFLLMGLGLVEAGLWMLTRWGRRVAGISAMLILIVSAAFVLPASLQGSDEAEVREGRESVQMFNWIRANTSCDARLLANQRTVGVFKAMTGRVALLEGMSPYLRPSVLDRLVAKLLEARDFFRAPSRSLDFLKREGIDYVVVASDLRLGHSFGARVSDTLRTTGSLELVYRAHGAQIFRVVSVDRRPPSPDIENLPGYRCERDEIAS
jgi:hypothetical protein